MSRYKVISFKYDQFCPKPLALTYSDWIEYMRNGKNSWTEYRENLIKLFYCFAGLQPWSKKRGIYMSQIELKSFLDIIDGFTQYWSVDEVFLKMDSDISDKKITLNEFIEYFCDKHVNPNINDIKTYIETQISWQILLKILNIFEQFDINHSKQLEYNQFARFGHKLKLTDTEIELLWHTIDIDNNGQISIVELFQWYKQRICIKIMTAFDDPSECFQDVDQLLFALQSGVHIGNGNAINFNTEFTSNIRRHHLLYASIDNDTQRTVLHRLVEELKVTELENELKVFSSKFELISTHKAFNYCSYKINVNNELLCEEFKKYKYKIKKENGIEYELKYDDELVIKKNGIYNIYISDGETYSNHLFQTIHCNEFINNEFYDELCCKFKLIHKDSILKLQHACKIPKQYHNDIISAKYLLVTCDNNKQKTRNYYRFNDINQINMILPFNSECNTCELYVQPTEYHKFVLLKTIKYKHKNTINSKLNHLFSLLKYYNQIIHKPEKVLNIFNFTFKQLKNELIPHLLQHKQMLYYMSKMKITMNRNVSILHRLINELKIKRLSPLLHIFECKLKQIEKHKSFEYYSFKMDINENSNHISQCEYKLETDKPNVVIHFKCDDEVKIKQNGTFNVYIKNFDLFDCDHYILIQKMRLNDSVS